METESADRLLHRPKAKSANRPEGFSLLEMMLVVTLILIVVSIATPVYQTCEVRTREAVLRDHLYTLRFLIDRFTLDNGRAPARLHELVEKGYPSADGLPTDPFTGSNETWQETKEDAPLSPSQIRQLTDWGLKTCTAGRISFPSKALPTAVGSPQEPGVPDCWGPMVRQDAARTKESATCLQRRSSVSYRTGKYEGRPCQ